MPGGPEVPSVLVVGGFPPVPGPVTAATVDLVRRQVAAGVAVHTASVRPGGAELVVRLRGPLAGWHLERARRATAATGVVVALDDGVPAAAARPGGVGRAVDLAAATLACRSLALGLRRFAAVTVLVAADPGVGRVVLSPLWRNAGAVVVAGPAALPAALGIPDRLVHRVPEPAAMRGLATAGVGARGPAEVAPLAMPRYAAGVLGRRVLGRRFMPVYTRILRAQHRARPLVRRARAILG